MSSALRRDAPPLRREFQDKTADFEAQHAQEAELLRAAWVLELNVWGESVIMLRHRLDQKTPDARWLSDFLRKAHRAQRCYETAIELETFLTIFCADPEQPLLAGVSGWLRGVDYEGDTDDGACGHIQKLCRI